MKYSKTLDNINVSKGAIFYSSMFIAVARFKHKMLLCIIKMKQMEIKRIIKRNLSLNQIYILIDTNYVSLIDGYGCTCDNCGKLIANIATIKGSEDNKTYSLSWVNGGKSFPIMEGLYKHCFSRREKLKTEKQYKSGLLIITLKAKQ